MGLGYLLGHLMLHKSQLFQTGNEVLDPDKLDRPTLGHDLFI